MPEASTTTKDNQNHHCCGSTHRGLWNGCSALLVPLMIAVFTITTTMLQMNATKQINEQNLKIATDSRDIANYTRHQQLIIEDARLKQERDNQDKKWESDKLIAQENRKQDLQIAEDNRKKDERIEQARHERDIEIANQTRLHQISIEEGRLKQEREIEDERRAADFRATENRQMDTILATYLKEMGEFLLTENFTLENRRLATVLRAKTLAVLRQVDNQRKSYLVQFLYEAELLIHNRNPLDLSGAELNKINLSGRKLDNISLSGAILRDVNFTETSLNNSNFNHAQLTGASFSACQAFNSNFTDAKLINSNFEKSTLIKAIFDRCDASESNFTRAILTSASFVQARLANTTCREIQGQSILFYQAELYDVDFNGAHLVNANFESASLRGTSFKLAKLSSTNWENATVLGVDFREAHLKAANITNRQLRQAFSFDKAVFSNGTTDLKTNLLTNGDAEGKRNTGCSIANWKGDKTMVARAYSSDKVPAVLGTCFFTGIENEVRATMYQRVNITSSMEIARNKRLVWIQGRCHRLIPEDENFPQIRLRLFDHENNNLRDQIWTLSKKKSCNKHFPDHLFF
jgi:uncharacterized protein YjbI with pentapeptide repeats